ncbi:hypothetical protein [Trinickia sp.]|uniref:hypothetical protein n=1 Tax=Trinickia sp. TaxID=2571163 RepID=UPI003F7F8A8C
MMLKIQRWFILVATAVAVMGCDSFASEPVYRGISVSGMNYMPFNLSRFTIRDKYGNTAGGGGDLPPGSGEGSVSCCYTLKGTEFTVDWEVYDIDEITDIYAPLRKIHKTAKVYFPEEKIPGGAGEVMLAAHFYPDDHVEFEFREDLSGSRIDYAEVDYWFQSTYGNAANPDDLDEFAAFRRTTRVAAQGWRKHRLTDSVDLEQYVYYTLLVNPRFDEHPAVQRILREAVGKAGAFGEAMQKLPDVVFREIKSNHFDSARNGAERG